MEPNSRVWFITGCSSGFGRALAERVLAQGQRVIATARDATALEGLAARHPESCRALALDVTDVAQVKAAIAEAAEMFGRLDVVVNNAGYGLIGAFEEFTPDEIEKNFATNFFGALEVIRAALPILRAQGSGHLVNISAAATISNYPGFSIYGASKAALESVSESLALELQPFGIKITIVQPGPFRTDFVRRSLTRAENEIAGYERSSGKFRRLLETMDGKQPGDPEKAAEAIIAAVESETPPLRLVLGKYAHDKVRRQLAATERELSAWEAVGRPTEFGRQNMNRFRLFLACLLAGAFVSCASPQISTSARKSSEPRATALLAASQRAHGGEAFAKVRTLSVRYEGQWAPIGPRFQPVLSDTKFRRGSEERLVLDSRLIAQEHTGPAGKKIVVRTPEKVSVNYNGVRSTDAEVEQAAALVADAYTMFLLGPFYFDRPGVTLSSAGDEVVDGAVCDKVLAVLRPGFGFAEEDRVVLFIDRANKQLRRVRMTLNGLESTRGAEVDVTFREFRTIGGIVWPTDFDERIRVPFQLHAHHWTMLGLTINPGFRAADLDAAGFKGRAAIPAAPLPGAR